MVETLVADVMVVTLEPRCSGFKEIPIFLGGAPVVVDELNVVFVRLNMAATMRLQLLSMRTMPS